MQKRSWQYLLIILVPLAILAVVKIPDSKVQARTIEAYEEGQFSFSFENETAELFVLQNGALVPFAGDSIIAVLTPRDIKAQAHIKVSHVTNELLGDHDPLGRFAEVILPTKVAKESRIKFLCRK